MRYTRLSLIYPSAYLLLGGLAAMALPGWLVHFFLSPSSYPEVAVRFVGVLGFVLGTLITLVTYYGLEKLYLPLFVLRLFVGAWLLFFYFSQNDPMFLVIFVIGGLGVLGSFVAYLQDKKHLSNA